MDKLIKATYDEVPGDEDRERIIATGVLVSAIMDNLRLGEEKYGWPHLHLEICPDGAARIIDMDNEYCFEADSLSELMLMLYEAKKQEASRDFFHLN